MFNLTLDQFLTQEQQDLEQFKAFYLSAAAMFPDHFKLSQTEELWHDEFLAYIECRSFNTVCKECDPVNCQLVKQRLNGADT
jgi:hypothetical protein